MDARRLSAAVAAVAVAACAWSLDASAVLGGRPVAVRSAPWTVSLRDRFGPNEIFNCTGVILNPSQVLTAAHCLFNSSGLFARLAQLTVRAGVSNFRHTLAGDQPQRRAVTSVRFFPGYVWHGGDESVREAGTDIAVLRLARPLDLEGDEARPIAVPWKDLRRPSGAGFLLVGFGRERASHGSSGALNSMTTAVVRAPFCSSALTLCGTSPESSSCPGDSGAGLVSAGPAPTLVGVLVTGSCARGGRSSYVDLAAPAILRFIEDGGGSGVPSAPPATRWIPAGWLSQPSYTRGGTLLPLLVSLPRSWITGTTPDGAKNVWNPLTSAEANVSRLGPYPSRPEFFQAIGIQARAKYLGQDPGAVVHSRVLELPAGPALEVIAHMATKIHGREFFYSIENYNLFHDGVGYDVEYQGAPSKDAVDIPVWQASARTVHFNGG